MTERNRMASPLVSVVMPAKNEERYIADAIQSILAQTYSKLELIVIDDYSTDRTAEIVRSIADPRLRLFQKTSEIPRQAASKNIGAELARGDFVAYQDADDVSHPQRIELQLKEASSATRTHVVGSWVEQRIGKTAKIWRLPQSHEDIVAGFKRHFNRVTFVSGTMLLPRSLALAVPNRPRFHCFEDWDQLCRMYETGEVSFCNVPSPLYTYHIRPKGSKSGLKEWARQNAFERACRARRLHGLPEFETVNEFDSYIAANRGTALLWGTVKFLLEAKVTFEVRRIKRLAEVAGQP